MPCHQPRAFRGSRGGAQQRPGKDRKLRQRLGDERPAERFAQHGLLAQS